MTSTYNKPTMAMNTFTKNMPEQHVFDTIHYIAIRKE